MYLKAVVMAQEMVEEACYVAVGERGYRQLGRCRLLYKHRVPVSILNIGAGLLLMNLCGKR